MEKIRRICLGMIAGIGTVIFLFLTYFGWRHTINMSIENESLIMTYAVIALPYMAGSLALWCGSLKSLMVKAVNRIIINFSRVNM